MRLAAFLLAATAVINLASAETAEAQEVLTAPKTDYGVGPTGVNYIDGEFTASMVDLSIGDLSLSRHYIGRAYGHRYMTNWNHNFDIWNIHTVVAGDSYIQAVIGSKTYWFLTSGVPDEQKQTAPGVSLIANGSQYVFTDRDGTVYIFPDGNSQVSNIIYPDGRSLSFSYISGKLKTVVSTNGYALVFDYDGANVTAVCGYNLTQTYVSTATTCASAALKVAYGYTGWGLTSFTDVMGNIAHYANMGSGSLLTCLTDPGSSVCKITNHYVSGRFNIDQQTMGDGKVWQIYCGCNSLDDDPNQGGGYMDPNGNTVAVNYLWGSLNYYIDPNGKQYNLTYFYGYPYSIEMPEGNKVTFSYNSRQAEAGLTFIAKPGSTLDPITKDIKIYPSSCSNPKACNKPLTITDAIGNVTSYTYDSSHGGVLTETKPPVGGVSPVVRHAYAQRYAWIKNAGGGYSSAPSPIWVPTEDRTCTSSATVSGACSAGAADEIVTSYDYGPDSGPNNLLLRGKVVTVGSMSLRTCYSYDEFGNKVGETSPRAGLAVCP